MLNFFMNCPKNLSEWFYLIKKWFKRILPGRILKIYYIFFPFFSKIIFNIPSKNIILIGITGTDGKSSTVLITAKILKEAGYKVGFSSSIFFSDGEKERINDLKVTMPGRFFMRRLLKQWIQNGCQIGIIEVTSEGIKQERHRYIDFDILLLTNITPEHLEAHGGFLNYKNTKAKIFKALASTVKKGFPKTIIVNGDFKECLEFLNYNAEQKFTYGIINQNVDLKASILECDLKNTKFILSNKKNKIEIKTSLIGPFIIKNILAAATIAYYCFNVEFEKIKKAIEKIPTIPGRFEIVSSEPLVIVDYAHTVFAVEELLKFLRKNWNGKIIHVFGAAGGGRDKWKRPVLGKLSEMYTDFTILTEENSFDDSTEKILNDILLGFSNKDRVEVISNRKKAIRKGLSMVKKDTLLLVTGKGCETVIMGPYGRKIPHNDKEVILSFLKHEKSSG